MQPQKADDVMEVTVTVKDGDKPATTMTLPLPREQAIEMRLATALMQESAISRETTTAEVYLRLCSLGIDIFMKEWSAMRLKQITTDLKQILGG